MKKYRWVLTAVFAAFLVGTSGCGKKTETIPITTISQSTDDDDPEDNLAASGDSDEIPEYDVDLSKNLNSFQLAIWGDTYEIPESYADFTALGWVYSGDDTKEIQPESFSEGESFEKDGNQITVDIANPDTTAKPVAECLIGGIHIDTSTAEGQNIYVGLPNGVTLQQSLMEDAESIYGAPKDRYETDTSVQFTYEYGLYQTITLGFDNKTGILYSLDMQNFTTTADAEALDGVSDATTPEVEAYQAPEADSSEINDWTVRFDDVLYHLPVPVSELLDHDWTVNMKESDTAVLNGNTATSRWKRAVRSFTAPYIITARRRRQCATVLLLRCTAISIRQRFRFQSQTASRSALPRAIFWRRQGMPNQKKRKKRIVT